MNANNNPETIYSAGSGDWTQAQLITVSGWVRTVPMSHRDSLRFACYGGCECFRVQRSCIEFALKARPQRRYIPKARLQYRIWWLVTSRGFEYGIFCLIMVNTVTLAMKVHRSLPLHATDNQRRYSTNTALVMRTRTQKVKVKLGYIIVRSKA